MRKTETELQNIQMASRISQMMIQQLMENVKAMSQDLGSALNQLYELQYKYTALQKHLNLDVEALNKIANAQRLIDFDEASVKADEKENLEVAEVAEGDSTVVITSTATDDKGNDRGIFRSRVKLSESGVPDLINGLTGKKVGDKVQVKLNDVLHEVELLSVRNPKKEVATEVSH
jgi:seryl-tRNA synthetase